MAVRRILVALIAVSSAFIAPAGAQTTTDHPGDQTSALGRAVSLAKTASLTQAAGIPRTIELNTIRGSRLASEAIAALASRQGVSLSPRQREQAAALDGLGRGVGPALADTVDAFNAFSMAASSGTVADVIAARGALLDSVVTLKSLFPQTTRTGGTCSPLDLTVLLIDPIGCDTIYERGTTLSIDVGGNDVYHNNAGGAGADIRSDIGYGNVIPHLMGMPAAAAIDLTGDDLYSSQGYGFTNGGARGAGAGFLLDVAGNDVYIGGNGAAAAELSACCIYPPAIFGVQIGPAASGFLLDAEGDDAYRGGNGFASAIGPAVARGLLFDASGLDTYYTATDCTIVPRDNFHPLSVGAQIDFPHTGCETDS